MKGKTWSCPRCGEENIKEFNACKRCGFVKQAGADWETKVTKKPEASQTSGKKKRIVLIAVLLLAIAGVFWWQSIAGIKGLIQDGEYEKAMSQTKEKPYCAFLQTEVVEAWVEDLWSRRLYEEAFYVFEQWYEEDDKESRIDALVDKKNNERLDQAREALENGEWEKVYDLLDQVDEGYPEVETLREDCLDGQNQERLDQAQEAYDRNDWNQTLTYLDTIEGELPEAETLRTEAIWNIAVDHLRSEKTQEAEDYLRQIPELPEAQSYLEILQLIEENRYYEAAQEVCKIPGTVNGLTNDEWKSRLQQRAKTVYEGAELELQITAIDRPFSGYSNQTTMNPDVSYWTPIRQKIKGTALTQEELFNLLKNCKGSGSKKTLILWDMAPYRGGRHSYCLAGDIMQSLPEDMFPGSWEEVDYVITLICTVTGDGGYYRSSFGVIDAAKEHLRATVCKASTPGGVLYSGQRISGEPSPETFSYFSGTDLSDLPFISSGLPDCVMEQVALMVDYIEKR